MRHKLFQTLSRKIANLYSTRVMLFLLLSASVFFWLFNFSHAAFSNPTLIKTSGGTGLLDVMPFYSAQEAFLILGHYGAQGRELYLKFIAADFIFIPCYSLGFSLLFTRVVRAIFGENDRWLRLNLLPLSIGLVDCIENIFILSMLLMYPERNLALGTLSGLATLCKNILTLVSLLSLSYLGVRLLIRRLTLHFKSIPPSTTKQDMTDD